MAFDVIKHYGHNEGLSACFRQWRAKSHCRHLHGYALSFRFQYQCEELDDCNWVVDFGGFKELKEWLKNTFDHKLLIADDDPAAVHLALLEELDLVSIRYVPHTGCERFAEMAAVAAETLVQFDPKRVWLASVTVAEHEGNSAIYYPTRKQIYAPS